MGIKERLDDFVHSNFECPYNHCSLCIFQREKLKSCFKGYPVNCSREHILKLFKEYKKAFEEFVLPVEKKVLRVGRFVVSKDFLFMPDQKQFIKKVFEKLVVLFAVEKNGCITYIAISDLFKDYVYEGDLDYSDVPLYDFSVERNILDRENHMPNMGCVSFDLIYALELALSVEGESGRWVEIYRERIK